jgi:arsenate reductase-like glutaredoxin family protein
MGEQTTVQSAWVAVNKAILKSALHQCKGITLDIDATEIIANKSDAKWTYKKNKGDMPMVGHIAETGQIVACDFREGNASPAKENFEFIKPCEGSLPDNGFVKKLRIDAAGYQTKIIQYCDTQQIDYAIRAKMSRSIKEQINALSETDWSPLLNKKGEPMESQQTYHMPHWISDYDQPFTLVIQRKAIIGQTELELQPQTTSEEITANGFIYRAIATNQESLSNDEIIHWYNQRGEDSENRIKELKLDFGGDTLPCSDFKANNVYFLISALSYNLFALMRQLLPVELSQHRVTTIRWRVYAIAAKIVKTGRQILLKLKSHHKLLLENVLMALRSLEPPPI